MEIRLHGAVWRSADTQRREEWQRMLDELNADNQMSPKSGEAGDFSLEVVRLPSQSFQIRILRDVFERMGEVTFEPERMDSLFRDYSTTIRQMVRMDGDSPARGFESMDYAKRVVHDEAADYVRSVLSEFLNIALVDARRIFTLIFLIGGDLPADLVRYHRVH